VRAVRILTKGMAAADVSTVIEEPEDWVTALRSTGPMQDEALRRLHSLMVAAARRRVWQMRSMLPGAGVQRFDELANSAADDALATLLGKLDSFEGRSRFTTWAYKFAILQASVEVRRQAWAGRGIELEELDIRVDAGPSPEQQAEAADLATAIGVALDVALTPHQRRIAVALLIDHVPIDVLAERLGTSRGALYKTLHEARTRLRAHLTSTGYLAPTTTAGIS
jgi:RNA polymerase sigma-70 factor, ECF subfamily